MCVRADEVVVEVECEVREGRVAVEVVRNEAEDVHSGASEGCCYLAWRLAGMICGLVPCTTCLGDIGVDGARGAVLALCPSAAGGKCKGVFARLLVVDGVIGCGKSRDDGKSETWEKTSRKHGDATHAL